MPEKINQDRRRLLGTATAALAAAPFVAIRSADAQPGKNAGSIKSLR